MRFIVDDELREFGASVHDLLTASDVPAAVRAWSAGKHTDGLRLWSRLAELGVTALAVPERHGGLDAGPVALAVTFEALGYHAVPGPLVETVAVAPALLGGGAAELWLPGIADGSVRVSVAAPPHVPYALDADVAEVTLRADDDAVRQLGTPDATPMSSVDGARRLFAVAGVPGTVVASGTGAAGRAFEVGVLAVSGQLLGLAQGLLDRAVTYAGQRKQYGREIGSYQAVKHLLADVATRVELARPLLHGAAVALAGGTGTVARDVSAARVACADAAHLAGRTSLQVHGAIGYTAEHDVGLALTKVRALLAAWGTQAFHRGRVMSALTGTPGAASAQSGTPATSRLG